MARARRGLLALERPAGSGLFDLCLGLGNPRPEQLDTTRLVLAGGELFREQLGDLLVRQPAALDEDLAEHLPARHVVGKRDLELLGVQQPALQHELPELNHRRGGVHPSSIAAAGRRLNRASTIVAMATLSGITNEAELRRLIGSPRELVVSKISNRLNDLTRQFVERSPFLCLATSAPDGSCDVSPRGDPAGFVRILDERTLLIPDRPGNRIADSLRNILANPHVGLLFVIPGVGDTFRVNGRATLVTDEELLSDSAVEGKVPKLGILVEVDEAYTQCSKALIRSDLWNPERHVDRSELPSSGAIMRSLQGDDFDADEYDRARAARYARREGLY
jgi:uncharacterized protein